MKFGHEILKYRDDILRDLAKLIAVPSVCTDPLPGKPFGEAPAQALECILSMAKNMGFETENTDNYAGAVYYGTGTEYVDVLTHVDVVPAGDGWDTDPFQMVIKDGMAYGRGVSDDKGAAIVALYCLKALKDAGNWQNQHGRHEDFAQALELCQQLIFVHGIPLLKKRGVQLYSPHAP